MRNSLGKFPQIIPCFLQFLFNFRRWWCHQWNLSHGICHNCVIQLAFSWLASICSWRISQLERNLVAQQQWEQVLVFLHWKEDFPVKSSVLALFTSRSLVGHPKKKRVTVTRWLSSDLHATLSYYFFTVFADIVLHLNCIWEFSCKDLVINPCSDIFPTFYVSASQMTTKSLCLSLYHSVVMMPKNQKIN